ncbi:FAD/NAD(P)-binding protein [Zobellia sp. 1_MG-2023]|uniref:FAD/NAD(P)-binding protein n=1 Tax=Zobellia sp. 1_MG-2023 TaxID=3062626 RepID=UPI0026E20E03|nr:FAD/NAD(P)-binding protein [Zobellia sp. 1_MG-2023]MDO6821320.1 FAD/NAD(P)-binding protein [Zobellia sp. 1_MG-2023]
MEFWEQPYKVAIVGVGPKGLYAMERLLAELNKGNVGTGVEIHLFEKTGFFGAGATYCPNQPEYLIMNYPNRKINAWPQEIPEPCVNEAPNFVEWLSKGVIENEINIGDKFSSRKKVGEYLIYCFDLLQRQSGNTIKIVKHVAKVNDIKECSEGLLLKYSIDDGDYDMTLQIDEALLTTGHTSFMGKLSFKSCLNSTQSDSISYVYPVASKLSGISERLTIGIKGIGLTFIDTALALTEGRGGIFKKLSTGEFQYLRSGKEPEKIYAFSRSGLPMVPRSSAEGQERYRPIYFTKENIYKRAGIGNKVKFSEHVLPLYIAEIQYRYYSIIFEKNRTAFTISDDLRTMKLQIEHFHKLYPNEYRFTLRDMVMSKSFSADSLELDTLNYLKYLVIEAEMGSNISGFMAAATTWANLSETFNEIFSFSGMTSQSHHIFDKEYRSMLNRISYGPPIENAKKIIALAETGILDFDYAKNPNIKKLDRGWSIQSLVGKPQQFDLLVDARIPKSNNFDDWSPLLKHMKNKGLIRPYIVNSEGSYELGCPEIDKQGRAIGKNGGINHNISFYGTPTEGAVYDNDTLSRARNNFASSWAAQILNKIQKREFA